METMLDETKEQVVMKRKAVEMKKVIDAARDGDGSSVK